MPLLTPFFAGSLTLALLVAGSASAQAQRTELKPGVLRPGPLPTQAIRPTPRPQAEIVLRNVPDDMLKIGQDADWPDPRRNDGILGVYRKGLPGRVCRQPSDSIDLRRIRTHGFRVVGYKLNDGLGPSGYKIAGYSNVRTFRYASPNSEQLLNESDPAKIERISVTPQVWVFEPAFAGRRMGCAATWGLEIRVIGPKGINPYTGRPQ